MCTLGSTYLQLVRLFCQLCQLLFQLRHLFLLQTQLNAVGFLHAKPVPLQLVFLNLQGVSPILPPCTLLSKRSHTVLQSADLLRYRGQLFTTAIHLFLKFLFYTHPEERTEGD